MLLFEEVEEKTVWLVSLYLILGVGLCILVVVIFLFVNCFLYWRSTSKAMLRHQQTLAKGTSIRVWRPNWKRSATAACARVISLL